MFSGDDESKSLLSTTTCTSGTNGSDRNFGFTPVALAAMTEEHRRMVLREAMLKREAAKAVANVKASMGFAAKDDEYWKEFNFSWPLIEAKE